MKILVIHEISYFEGPVFEFQEFAESLASLGHEVLVLDILEKSKNGVNPKSRLSRTRSGRVSSSKIQIFSPRIRIRHDVLRPLGVILHMFYLAQIFITDRPEVVFSYSVPTSGPTVALLGKMSGVPVVHRCIDISHMLRPGLYTNIVKFTETLTFKWSSAISTHNQSLKNYAVRKGAKEDRVFIHYPPVDSEYFGPVSRKQSADRSNIIFLGTLFESTGLRDVLRSAITRETDRSKWKLRIVGDGPELQMLKTEAQRLGLSSQVEFRGWREYSELAAELAWANVAILPFQKNLLTDSALPQKAIQYMAAGLPVVSTSLTGTVSELSGIDGIMFVPSPDEVFVAALNSKDLVPADRNKLMERFGKNITTKALSDFLRTMSKESSARINGKSRE